jgi:Oxidoreductase family, NAD-binding Rossmann fold
MASGPAYLIVGKGRWGLRMQALLVGEKRRAEFAADIRKRPDENAGAYEERMTGAFRASAAQIAWLCVPPGPRVPSLIRAAIAARLHLIVEKPWVYSREETSGMQAAARRAELRTGVDFEYCMLSEVENWRREYQRRSDVTFGGTFTVNAGDHLGLSAMQNLGSHLLAIHAYAAPHSTISEIRCDYDSAEQRRVWLDSGKERVAEIDFLGSKEPIIQRFLTGFEKSMDGTSFPFDFDFAFRVKQNLEAF